MVESKKTIETTTHVYFSGGPFSLFFLSPFKARLTPRSRFYEFSSAYQYIVSSKALLFDDFDALFRSLNTTSIKKLKKIDQAIDCYDYRIWKGHISEIAFRANWNKISQNFNLTIKLEDTKNKILVYATQKDNVWGTGTSIEDCLNGSLTIENNLQGYTLMDVRKFLSKFIEAETLSSHCEFNEWERKIYL